MLSVLFCSLLGCSEEKVKVDKPKGLLSENEMIQLMMDFYILEAKVKEVRVGRDSAKVLYRELEPLVYQQHDIDSVDYRQSLEYYLHFPETMETFYSAIVDSLSLKERVANDKEKASKKKDKLKEAKENEPQD